MFSAFPNAIPEECLRQPESHQRIRHDARTRRCAAARGDDDILLAVPAHKCCWRSVAAGFQLVTPQFFAGRGVEGAELAIIGSADKYQPARSRDVAAQIASTKTLAFITQGFPVTQRYAPE